jgi:hypothetical protein
MAANFPTAQEDGTNLPNPASGNFQNSPSHSSQHSNANDAIKAIEAKLGIGASTPVVSRFMWGTGTGTSAWTQLTSAQLAASLSDETGTGLAVFATSPTLTTPKIDSIVENTPSNGTSINGLNIKSSKLNTNDSVVTANITNAAVTASKLSTGAAVSSTTAASTTTSTSYTTTLADAVTSSVTVTIGANGLALLSIRMDALNSGASANIVTYSVSGATTTAAADANILGYMTGTSETTIGGTKLITGLAAGSTTFTINYKVSANTGTFERRSISVVPL